MPITGIKVMISAILQKENSKPPSMMNEYYKRRWLIMTVRGLTEGQSGGECANGYSSQAQVSFEMVWYYGAGVAVTIAGEIGPGGWSQTRLHFRQFAVVNE